MAENTNFKWDVKVTRGDTRTIPIEFLNAIGEQEAVGASQFFYTAKKSIRDADEDAAIAIDPVDIVAVANLVSPFALNHIDIELTEAHTDLEPGDYYQDIQRRDMTGNLHFAIGVLTIEKRVTVRTAALP